MLRGRSPALSTEVPSVAPSVSAAVTLLGRASVLMYLQVLHKAYRLGPGVQQPLTEMSTRYRKIKFLGNRARPVLKADSLTAICEPIVYAMRDP
jgi:hypothetical protein